MSMIGERHEQHRARAGREMLPRPAVMDINFPSGRSFRFDKKTGEVTPR